MSRLSVCGKHARTDNVSYNAAEAMFNVRLLSPARFPASHEGTAFGLSTSKDGDVCKRLTTAPTHSGRTSFPFYEHIAFDLAYDKRSRRVTLTR